MPDLTPERIKTGLNSSVIGSEVLVFGEIASTNDLARDYLAKNFPEGLTVVADSQTRGRGRLGRAWHSAPGLGLYFSVLLRPRIDARHMPRLALMASVAVADAIGEFVRSAAKLKWPNDVLLNGKKTCGILSEY
ncbi:MAG: biotin--[acetyl-CoA-carboxylase] ligase, partial [Nitrospinae bacterium]|nr:biotin--[acetyl-CoA-carboxylase] ligase [Nitrospinota bacterium]